MTRKQKFLVVLVVFAPLLAFVVAKRMADKRPHLFTRVSSPVWLTFSADGHKLFVLQSEGRYHGQIVDVGTKSQTDVPRIQSSNYRFFFSPDNRKLFQLCDTGYETFNNDSGEFLYLTLVASEMHIYDASYGGEHTPYGLPDDFYGAYLDGNELVCESGTSTRRFDAFTGRVLATTPRKRVLPSSTLTPDGETPTGATLVPDGQTLWTYQGGKYHFWDLSAQKQLWAVAGLGSRQLGDTPSIQFSFDGKLVLMQSNQNSIIAYNTRIGNEEWRVSGPQSTVFALSPNGKSLYEARPDGEIWIWPV